MLQVRSLQVKNEHVMTTDERGDERVSTSAKVKELVIVSGKGGTGKTSISASFAALAKNAVIADGDVDAADLHLVLNPQISETHQFISGEEAVIRANDCISCGACMEHCRFDAIHLDHGGDQQAGASLSNCSNCTTCKRSCSLRTNAIIREMQCSLSFQGHFIVDPISCEGCGVCQLICPVQAIDMCDRNCGVWHISQTRCGPMVHARLNAAGENSGKLVSTVRKEAQRIAQEKGHSLVIVDGPPGIGCPAIASITGAAQVLVVSEPTISGEHDLDRVLSLTRHFGIRTAVCVNKWDLNPDVTRRIEERATKVGAFIVGRVRYDSAVTAAQMQSRAVVEMDAASGDDIRQVWTLLDME